ncbi:hypothetical protein EV702DRAFT_1051647 [Suillus placidus]|uniref:Uncharacterized protein n=1 Tax=Suillus placidus TaxID=48579 RepID=A0A9P6ZFG9_9AGAM|nr:hypothetical protein EV702DRAFT_1051647 [Suillus placidus]
MADSTIRLELPAHMQTFAFTFESKQPGPVTIEISLRHPVKRHQIPPAPESLVDSSVTEPESPEKERVIRWQKSQQFKRRRSLEARAFIEEFANKKLKIGHSYSEPETPSDFTRWYEGQASKIHEHQALSEEIKA